MGIGWVFMIRGDAGSYRIVVWIVSYCRLNRIVSYVLDRIVSAGLYQEILVFMCWLVTGWMGRMGRWCDRGGMDRR